MKYLLSLILILPASLSFADYSKHPQAAKVVMDLLKEDNIPAHYSLDLLKSVSQNARVLELIKPKKKKKDPSKRFIWEDYRNIFLSNDKLVEQALAFRKEHYQTLKRAEKIYGVPESIILGIMGVETRYGRITGTFGVLEALATLAFDYPRRSKFFTGELKEFIKLSYQGHFDAMGAKGSYAGAMGLGQFMPSSYSNFAVDFNNDGKKDLFNPTDAIGSIANYFKGHGWQTGEPVAAKALKKSSINSDILNNGFKPKYTLTTVENGGLEPIYCFGEKKPEYFPCFPTSSIHEKLLPIELEWYKTGFEYWVGFENFYVITRYNHSRWYSMTVYQLSEKIRNQLRFSK